MPGWERRSRNLTSAARQVSYVLCETRAAALPHLSEEELLLLLDVIEKLESSPVPPLSEPESQAVEAYYKALEFESRQARLAEPRKHRESAK